MCKERQDGRRVLMIGGHPRSGTTLLRELCNYHPDIAITNEFGCLTHLGFRPKDYLARSRRFWRRKGALRHLVLRARPAETRLARIRQALKTHIFGVSYFLRVQAYLLWHRYGERPVDLDAIEWGLRGVVPDKRIVGDKWPDYVFHLDRLVQQPGLTCLVIYRDCRNVTSSFLRLSRNDWKGKPWVKNLESAEAITKQWLRAIALMERCRERIHVVRYEDLLAEPQQQLQWLGQWLGVDPGGFPAHLIRTESLNKFKDGLTGQELRTVLKIAGPTLARLGYLTPGGDLTSV